MKKGYVNEAYTSVYKNNKNIVVIQIMVDNLFFIVPQK
jgi:hypothetical protein